MFTRVERKKNNNNLIVKKTVYFLVEFVCICMHVLYGKSVYAIMMVSAFRFSSSTSIFLFLWDSCECSTPSTTTLVSKRSAHIEEVMVVFFSFSSHTNKSFLFFFICQTSCFLVIYLPNVNKIHS